MKKIISLSIFTFLVCILFVNNANSQIIAQEEPVLVISYEGAPYSGIEFNGTNYYLTSRTTNEFFEYDASGNYIQTFTIEGVDEVRDLTFDGTYFYCRSAFDGENYIYQLDLTTQEKIDSIPNPANFKAYRIAYDTENDAFWISGTNTDILLIDRSGTQINSIPQANHQGLYIGGLAYDNATPGGPYLWYSEYRSVQGNLLPLLVQIDIAEQELTGLSMNTVNVYDGILHMPAGLFTYTAADFIGGVMSTGGPFIPVSHVYGYTLSSFYKTDDVSVVELITPKTGHQLQNDETITSSITNVTPATVPYSTQFPTGLDLGWNVLNANDDFAGGGAELTWNWQSSGAGHDNATFIQCGTSNSILSDDWLFSKAIYLEANTTYNISFWYNVETFMSSESPQDIEILIGSENIPDAMTSSILQLTGVENTDYLETNSDFIVETDGYYFLGWHNTSPLTDFLNIGGRIDDINLTFNPSSENEIFTFVMDEQTGDATINAGNHTIEIEVEQGTNVTALSPSITISDLSTIDHESGTELDFSSPVIYTVTAENGSEQEWTVTVDIETGIIENENQFMIYPNPSSGIFNIQLNSKIQGSTNTQIIITDITGKQIYTSKFQNFKNSKIDLSDQTSGVYFICIVSNDKIFNYKIIIE